MKKVKIEKFIQPLGCCSPSEIAMKNGLHFSFFLRIGMMRQMLKSIEQHGKLPTYYYTSVTESPVAAIVDKHEICKLLLEKWGVVYDA